jgi:hypothetical protein
MDITDVVYGLICAVEGIICFAKWNYKDLKDRRGTGAAVVILLSVFIMFFCIAVTVHNIIGT